MRLRHRYGPHQLAGGHSEVRIQNDIYRIVFDGNGFIHKSAVDYYALVRAAELTVQQGRNYLRVLGADTDVKTTKVFIPGQTFATSNTYGTGNGHATAYPVGRNVYANAYGVYTANTFTTVSSTPSYSTAIQKPIVTIDIQTLPRRIDPCLDARQVLQGALEKKLKLESATVARPRRASASQLATRIEANSITTRRLQGTCWACVGQSEGVVRQGGDAKTASLFPALAR